MTDPMLALKLAGDLAIAYPGRTVTDDHARSWAAEFQSESENVARSAAAMLRQRSMDPPSVAQVRQAIREASGYTMSGPWGELGYAPPPPKDILPLGVLRHGIHHLRRVMDGHIEERESMSEPWDCTCGFEEGTS